MEWFSHLLIWSRAALLSQVSMNSLVSIVESWDAWINLSLPFLGSETWQQSGKRWQQFLLKTLVDRFKPDPSLVEPICNESSFSSRIHTEFEPLVPAPPLLVWQPWVQRTLRKFGFYWKFSLPRHELIDNNQSLWGRSMFLKLLESLALFSRNW